MPIRVKPWFCSNLNGYDDSTTGSTGFRFTTTIGCEYANQMTESIQDQLDKHHVDGQIVAIDGHPAKALSDLAEKEQADAIIVGNSGKSGFQKFFVGSVSEKIVKESPCSVIVVK